ncbi:hypothetical protein M3603_10980 [Rummeliibacillus stabekisii]|uniref:hypothetical protein n=1 Tax=Rummeliibacillus stabekisii TaxID=241244 RepID=UPI00203E9CE1|nr:hypothetical protein [Rummeliibacillus stabekisii]MCM3317171.1 hypothetical protein [Rummeliibacillus stabekisii]
MPYNKHFGVKIFGKSSGLKLTRENYIEKITFHNSHFKERYTDLVLEANKADRLYNYDRNMDYFRILNKEEFNIELKSFLSNNKSFVKITDLASLDGKSGYYIMVLDEYALAYIGTSRDIKKRIQQHWRMQMNFDRMIFGNKENSILSINSFRALDTTRIFVNLTSEIYSLEDKLISQFDNKYLLNRTSGGLLNGLSDAIVNRKIRALSTKDNNF